MTETRKLAAILAAEVVGYSRLAGADEDRILARLRALRSDLIDPTIAVHHGRVVKRTGDGSLIEFRNQRPGARQRDRFTSGVGRARRQLRVRTLATRRAYVRSPVRQRLVRTKARRQTE